MKHLPSNLSFLYLIVFLLVIKVMLTFHLNCLVLKFLYYKSCNRNICIVRTCRNITMIYDIMYYLLLQKSLPMRYFVILQINGFQHRTFAIAKLIVGIKLMRNDAVCIMLVFNYMNIYSVLIKGWAQEV